MITCHKCHAIHPNNTLFCGECGEYLGPGRQTITGRLSEEAENSKALFLSAATKVSPEAPDERDVPGTITLEIGYPGRKVTLPLQKDIVLGRLDPASGNYPDVDLTCDGGLEKGISRRHVMITRRQHAVFIEDLGSVNGSFFNGRRLTPYLPQPLHDGDQLQLGRLTVRIHLSRGENRSLV